MKREIKFRALYDGVWYYQTLVEILTITLASFRLGEHKTQFTGLHDASGKEIYEGDIVNGVTYKDFSVHIGKVLYDYNGYMIVTLEKSLPLSMTEKLEVIGNVHQDSYLLYVEKKSY